MARALFLGFKTAAEMSHRVVNEGHLYLDLLAGRPDGRAAEVLAGLGIGRESIADATERRAQAGGTAVAREPGDRLDCQASPHIYGIVGRAEAFASALGDGDVRSTDVLLALLWSDEPPSLLEAQDVNREQVLAALADRGIELPRAAPPEIVRRNMSQKIELPKANLNAAIRILRERHPPGHHPYWGVNSKDDLGVIIAEDGIDLEGIVAEASAAPT